jgi:hypothetical protein
MASAFPPAHHYRALLARDSWVADQARRWSTMDQYVKNLGEKYFFGGIFALMPPRDK